MRVCIDIVQIAAVAASLAVCAATANAQRLPPSCGAPITDFHVSFDRAAQPPTAMPSGQAEIYFIEVSNVDDHGRVARPTIKFAIDGSWVGATQGFSYMRQLVRPGLHHLCAQWQSHFSVLSNQISLNEVDAQAGASYYFRAQITSQSHGSFSVDLEPVSADEGEFLISQGSSAVSERK